MKFGKHFKVVREVRNTTDNRYAIFHPGEVVYFVEEDRQLGANFLVFSALDGWLLRLHADVVPQFLEAI